MITQDVEKVVTILKLLKDARSIDKRYNTLPAIIANRNMLIEYNVFGDTFIRIVYGDYKYSIALSYQDMYYGFDSMMARSLIQRAINALIHQAQHPTEKV